MNSLGTYATLNNGGAFEIFGLECKSNDEGRNNDSLNQNINEVINLNCKDTLKNNEQIIQKNLQFGDSFLGKCSSNCIEEPVSVFGSTVYSEDSSLCKAATHLGILDINPSVKSLKFKILIEKGWNI